MLDDIKDSIKAKLYDFAYTPFMSSYIISWVLLNHKYLLVYFGDSALEKKLMHLSVYHIEFFYPFYIALIYVFIYPAFALGFYYITLIYNKLSKLIKQKIEDETPLTQEEAREIRKEVARLTEEKDEVLTKLRKKEEEYKIKLENDLNPLQNEIEAYKVAANVSNTMIESMKTTNGQLENQLNQAKGFLSAKNDEYAELEKKIIEFEKQLASVGVVNATVEVGGSQRNSSTAIVIPDNEFSKVVRYLHDSYDTTYEANILDTMYKEFTIPKAVTRNILNELIQQEILSKNSSNQIQITPDGGLKLVDMVKGIQ
jgi:polyhydroxyalkanoate synthesis regulator phasin